MIKKVEMLADLSTAFYVNLRGLEIMDHLLEPSLHELAIRHHTDKGYFHYFTPLYGFWLEYLRYSPLQLLEIGFANGNSIDMWSDYFSNHQKIYCVDINTPPPDLKPNCVYFQIDQAQRHLLNSLPHGLDLIIDDGGHTMEQQQVSFAVLFHHLNPGGYYILEDLQTSLPSYSSTHHSSPTNNTIRLLLDLKTGSLSHNNDYYVSGREFWLLHQSIESIDIVKVGSDSITSRIIKKKLP
jgi:hypothetical protein